MQATATGVTLRYQSAAPVGTPVGQIAQLAVHGRDGTVLGTLDGVLIEPETARFTHLVVATDAPNRATRKLVPIDSLIYLTCEAGTARLEVDADALVAGNFDLDAIPPMGQRVEHENQLVRRQRPR